MLVSNEHHDWGDDFAMYLQQSKNIISGNPQADNHYLFNPDAPEYAPKTYSVGFPLILSPIWLLKSNKILLAKYILVTCYVCILFLVYHIVRKRIDSISFAALITGLIGLAYYLMDLEKQILADLPLFLWISIWWRLFVKDKPQNFFTFFVTGLVCAMAYLTKTIGITCLAATIILLFAKSTKENIYQNIKNSIVVVVIFAMVVVVVNTMCRQESTNDTHFLSLVTDGDIAHRMVQNLIIYKNETLALIGTLRHGEISGIARIASYLWCILFMAGFVIDVKKELRAEHIFCLLYLIGILLFPNFEQGNRYLIPLIPFFFYFAFAPFKDTLKYSRQLIVFMMLVILALQVLSLDKKAALKNQRAFQPKAMMMYENIKRRTTAGSRVLTAKPRLIGFMTERECGTVSKEASEGEVERFIRENNFQYILIQNDFNHPGLSNYTISHKQGLKVLLHNEGYQLYEILPL